MFRTEYGKIVAVLCKTYGLSNIELAEDIVSDTFLKATETWGLKGIPDKPKAWLYQVATYALEMVKGKETVLKEALKINLNLNPLILLIACRVI